MRLTYLGVILPLMVACGSATDKEDSLSSPLTLPACAPTLTCGPPALAHKKRNWRHPIETWFTRMQGTPYHRGRDMMVTPGDRQYVLAKFTYGLTDKDLKGEDVDIYVQRGCSAWELLGTAQTTRDGSHSTVEGVEDTGGRVYFEIPASKRLPLGQHRIRLVVAGDGTSTDLTIDVVNPGTKVFVSDIDGTLTTSEYAELSGLVQGELPDANPAAAQALRALTSRGYRAVYISSRAEWLTQRARDFLKVRGFPQGTVRTSFSHIGLNGEEALEQKITELDALLAQGLKIEYAFGNRQSDSDAYADANIQPLNHRIFFKTTEPYKGRKISSYSELTSDFASLPRACQ